MNGKSKCKILKDIRRQIAAENDIAYVTSECKFQGECTGTCPKCEAEVRYLEEELAKRRRAGKAVAVAGVAAAVMITASGCDLLDLFIGPRGGDPLPDPDYYATTAGVPAPNDDWQQSTDPTEDSDEPTEIMGEPVLDDEMMGDLPSPE